MGPLDPPKDPLSSGFSQPVVAATLPSMTTTYSYARAGLRAAPAARLVFSGPLFLAIAAALTVIEHGTLGG